MREMLILAGRGRHWLPREIVGGPRKRSANATRGAAGALPYDLASGKKNTTQKYVFQT